MSTPLTQAEKRRIHALLGDHQNEWEIAAIAAEKRLRSTEHYTPAEIAMIGEAINAAKAGKEEAVEKFVRSIPLSLVERMLGDLMMVLGGIYLSRSIEQCSESAADGRTGILGTHTTSMIGRA